MLHDGDFGCCQAWMKGAWWMEPKIPEVHWFNSSVKSWNTLYIEPLKLVKYSTCWYFVSFTFIIDVAFRRSLILLGPRHVYIIALLWFEVYRFRFCLWLVSMTGPGRTRRGRATSRDSFFIFTILSGIHVFSRDFFLSLSSVGPQQNGWRHCLRRGGSYLHLI